MDVILPLIWVSWAPLKVVFFSWPILLEKFLSRENLVKHGVLLNLVSASCGFYDEFLELVFHFFSVTCEVVVVLWYKNFRCFE